jgi:starvation-inducible outer membrane lipoprotein
MDSLKSVIGCRQKDIEQYPSKYPGIQYANDYYKLWAFNGFTGIQKFRAYNNYANPNRKKANS